jgi:hypothetical protein
LSGTSFGASNEREIDLAVLIIVPSIEIVRMRQFGTEASEERYVRWRADLRAEINRQVEAVITGTAIRF